MAQFPNPMLETVIRVLSQHIKPCFAKTPHSLVNPSTGRKRSRPAGGPSAALDFYENQEWKAHPGIPALLLWCLKCTQVLYDLYLGFVFLPIHTQTLDEGQGL
jgi:hypothetical protein